MLICYLPIFFIQKRLSCSVIVSIVMLEYLQQPDRVEKE